MVNLKEISSEDLYKELVSREDGRAIFELCIANLKLQQGLKFSQEKAGEEILDFMQEYFNTQSKFYKERYRDTWWEAMKEDVVDCLMEDKDLKELVSDYMSLSVG